MTHDTNLIADIEAGKLPLRLLSDRVLVVAGWTTEIRTVEGQTGPVYFWPDGTFAGSDRPHPLALEHDALAMLPKDINIRLEDNRLYGTACEAVLYGGKKHPMTWGFGDDLAKAITLAYLRMRE